MASGRVAIPRVLAAPMFVVLLGGGGCDGAGGGRTAASGEAGAASEQAAPGAYPPGSVGAAVYGYDLTMDDMRQYFAAARNVAPVLAARPEFQVNYQFKLESPLDSAVRALAGLPTSMQAALGAAGLTPREFVLVHGAYTMGWGARVLLDSLGHDSVAGVNPRHLAFVREHEAEIRQRRAELDQLMARLRREATATRPGGGRDSGGRGAGARAPAPVGLAAPRPNEALQPTRRDASG